MDSYNETIKAMQQQAMVKEKAKQALSSIGFDEFFGDDTNYFSLKVCVDNPEDKKRIEQTLRKLFGVYDVYDMSVNVQPRLGGSSYYCQIYLPAANKINMQENKKHMKKRITESDLHNIVRESINMVLNEGQSDGKPIEKWNYWCANYYPDFIQKAWADNPNMAKHLEEKFDVFYNSVGPYGVMLKFYLALDSTNKRILEDYVMNNY